MVLPPPSAELAHAQTIDPQPLDTQAIDAQHHRNLLNEMIDLAAALARWHHSQATAPTPGQAPTPTPPQPDHSAAFDRTVAAMRRSVLLVQHLHATPTRHAQALAARNAQRHQDMQARQAAERDRTAVRTRIIRTVEDRIEAACPSAAPKADLRRELLERLELPDLDTILSRPVADTIAEILRDLGLNPHGYGQRRTPEALRALHAAASAPPPRPLLPAPPFPPALPSPASRPPNSETADEQTLANLAATLLLHPARTRGK